MKCQHDLWIPIRTVHQPQCELTSYYVSIKISTGLLLFFFFLNPTPEDIILYQRNKFSDKLRILLFSSIYQASNVSPSLNSLLMTVIQNSTAKCTRKYIFHCFPRQWQMFLDEMNLVLKQRRLYTCIEYSVLWCFSIFDTFDLKPHIYCPQRPNPCPIINNIMRDSTVLLGELLSSFFTTLHV